MPTRDALFDVRWTWDRSWGSIDARIVNRPGMIEYFELAAIAKSGHEPGPVAFRAEEIDALLAVVRRCDELINGHPKYRGEKALDPVLRGGK